MLHAAGPWDSVDAAVHGPAVDRGVGPLAYAVDTLSAHPLPERLSSELPPRSAAERIAEDLRHREERIIEWDFTPERLDQLRWEHRADVGRLLRQYVGRILERGGQPPMS
ncbi:hypothetical protein [Streptomyces sp. NPDC091217]|uniref:hypothetical protein n=1 Tax=Streptomyces sp. NPDC091217 TaxID=3365975 RepID=UPI003816189A